MWLWAISDAVSTSIPSSDTHRFVRLFFTGAARGVQSVRPAHQGYHQEVGRCEVLRDGRRIGVYLKTPS
jgi:hypothetical protein